MALDLGRMLEATLRRFVAPDPAWLDWGWIPGLGWCREANPFHRPWSRMGWQGPLALPAPIGSTGT
jgi:hypothetical protein